MLCDARGGRALRRARPWGRGRGRMDVRMAGPGPGGVLRSAGALRRCWHAPPPPTVALFRWWGCDCEPLAHATLTPRQRAPHGNGLQYRGGPYETGGGGGVGDALVPQRRRTMPQGRAGGGKRGFPRSLCSRQETARPPPLPCDPPCGSACPAVLRWAGVGPITRRRPVRNPRGLLHNWRGPSR